MKLTNLFLAGIVSFALASCSSLDDESTWGSGAVKFTSRIEGQRSVKATGTAWVAGDAIGVFMKTAGANLTASLAANVHYVTDESGTLTAANTATAVTYPETGKVDFVAYYPYTASLTGTTCNVSVADQSNQAAIDLLYSNNATSKVASADAVNLIFTHRLSKVVLTVTPSNNVSLERLTVTLVGLPTAATFDLATAALTVTSASTGNVTLNASADGTTFEGILLPQSATGSARMRFTLGGKTTEVAFPLSSLATNTSYAVPVTLNIASDGTFAITFDAATITDWTDVGGGETNVDFTTSEL